MASVSSAKFEAALATALESLGGTGAEELLRLLVETVAAISITADKVAATEQFAAAARDSAEAAARDSAAAAFAMSECKKSAATAAQCAQSVLATANGSSPHSAAAASCSSQPQPNTVMDGNKFIGTDPAMPGMDDEQGQLGEADTEAATRMAELLESAQRIAFEFATMLDDPDISPDPEAGAEQLRRGVAANQQEDFAAATAWFEDSYRRRPRVSTLLSVANMRLKLGDGPLAANLYSVIMEHPSATVRCRRPRRIRHACRRALPALLTDHRLATSDNYPLSVPVPPHGYAGGRAGNGRAQTSPRRVPAATARRRRRPQHQGARRGSCTSLGWPTAPRAADECESAD